MTTASTTAFCSAEIAGPHGFVLFVDGNGKITAGNGTLADPRPNAFSLVNGYDCPGATQTCLASCYVHGLKAAHPTLFERYRANSVAVRRIIANPTLADEWAKVFSAWIAEHCQGGFRWHVSGDVFSREYADWIVKVVVSCQRFASVPHWIYTRSLDLVPCLMRAPSLAVNISADRDNIDAARRVAERTGARVCYLASPGDDLPLLLPGDVIFPDYGLRGSTQAGQEWFAGLLSTEKKMVCPVDYHGKAENRRCGPCARCLV